MDPAQMRHRDAVRASVERLRTIDETAPLDAAGVAGAIASELHDLLGGSLSVAYRPARAANDWIIGAVGPRSEVISTSLARTVTASADWFRYDPLRPAVQQRNTVSATERIDAPVAAGPFFDRLGQNIGQTRLLLCDGPVLLAWIGILRDPERRHDIDRDVFRRVGLAARRRLRLALGVPASFKFSSFEVSLDAYPGEAYVVRRDGRVEFANALAAERLASSGHAILKELREAVGCYPAASQGFELHPLRASSMAPHFLATRRSGAADLEARLRHAGARWALTPRQLSVLRHLALGDANKDIATGLGMSVRTVEQHVATMLARAKVESRLRLVAKVWMG